jgi:hypothetical protein
VFYVLCLDDIDDHAEELAHEHDRALQVWMIEGLALRADCIVLYFH